MFITERASLSGICVELSSTEKKLQSIENEIEDIIRQIRNMKWMEETLPTIKNVGNGLNEEISCVRLVKNMLERISECYNRCEDNVIYEIDGVRIAYSQHEISEMSIPKVSERSKKLIASMLL